MRLLCLTLLFAVSLAKHEYYQGWKSYYVSPSNEEQFKSFYSIVNANEADVVSRPILQRDGVVIVKPEFQEAFTKSLDEHEIKHRIHQNDLKAAFDYDDSLIEGRRNATSHRNDRFLPFYNYEPLDVIYDYLREIARAYSHIATLVDAGTSYEGRPIMYMKISTTNFADRSKPVIFIDGGMHAREWMSIPAVMYAILRLVYRTEIDLLHRFDFILLPVVNPDGYEFSRNELRMWRKNRSNPSSDRFCAGTDPNRNFNFFWNTVGVDESRCGEQYPGPTAFSERETDVIRNIVMEYLPRMAMYMSMHSYGSMVLYPWNHDNYYPSNHYWPLQTVGYQMVRLLNGLKFDHFPHYIQGNGQEIRYYGISGTSTDWAHFMGVPLAFQYELPGIGENGFHLPPEYIIEVCWETWEALILASRRAGDIFSSFPSK